MYSAHRRRVRVMTGSNRANVQAVKLDATLAKLQGLLLRGCGARPGSSPGSSLNNDMAVGKATNTASPQVAHLVNLQPNIPVGTVETPVDDTAMMPATSGRGDNVVDESKTWYYGSTFVEGEMVERLATHTEGSELTLRPPKRQKVDTTSGSAQKDSVMIALSETSGRRPIPESESVYSAVAGPSTSKLRSEDSGTGKEGGLHFPLPDKNCSRQDGAKPFAEESHQRTKLEDMEGRETAPQVLVNECGEPACASTTNTECQELLNEREGRTETGGELARKLVDLQSALDNERRERLRLQAQLEKARQKEVELLKTIDDFKRERSDPIVVSAVMDAFPRLFE
ncbi:unnamed protein product [Somion occarium]|uniref:Uncharacterized protein n=1 Tax=Somion occarium TaxID=3059160 RepID=A0ABP1DTP0_9APHY